MKSMLWMILLLQFSLQLFSQVVALDEGSFGFTCTANGQAYAAIAGTPDKQRVEVDACYTKLSVQSYPSTKGNTTHLRSVQLNATGYKFKRKPYKHIDANALVYTTFIKLAANENVVIKLNEVKLLDDKAAELTTNFPNLKFRISQIGTAIYTNSASIGLNPSKITAVNPLIEKVNAGGTANFYKLEILFDSSVANTISSLMVSFDIFITQ